MPFRPAPIFCGRHPDEKQRSATELKSTSANRPPIRASQPLRRTLPTGCGPPAHTHKYDRIVKERGDCTAVTLDGPILRDGRTPGGPPRSVPGAGRDRSRQGLPKSERQSAQGWCYRLTRQRLASPGLRFYIHFFRPLRPPFAGLPPAVPRPRPARHCSARVSRPRRLGTTEGLQVVRWERRGDRRAPQWQGREILPQGCDERIPGGPPRSVPGADRDRPRQGLPKSKRRSPQGWCYRLTRHRLASAGVRFYSHFFRPPRPPRGA